MALVLVLHLPPDQQSNADRLLQGSTRLAVGMAVIDLAGAVLLCNAEYRRFVPHGLLASRDSGVLARWRAFDIRGRLLQADAFPGARALRGETVLPGQEMLYQDDAGTQIWTRVASVPMFDPAGAVTGVVSMIYDIDHAKRSAQALSS